MEFTYQYLIMFTMRLINFRSRRILFALVFCSSLGISISSCGPDRATIEREILEEQEAARQERLAAETAQAEKEAERIAQEAAQQEKLAQEAVLEEKRRLAESTRDYWSEWKQLVNGFDPQFQEYLKSYSVSNSQGLSQLYYSMADSLTSLSVVNVDPELVKLAADASLLYRRIASLYQEQSNIFRNYQEFQSHNESSEKAVEWIVRSIVDDDIMSVPREMAAEQEKFEKKIEENFSVIAQSRKDIEGLIANRDALKLSISSKYSMDLESF